VKIIKKRDYFAFALTFALVILILFLVLRPSPPPVDIDFDYQNGTVLFYYGESCPHCKNIENYIKENNLDAKLIIFSREVYSNQSNQDELFHVAGLCKINRNMVGVPLMFYNGNCFIGDVDGIKLLKSLV